ncbi:MAG: hypothetical protein AAGG46_01040 [Planctomycetota bacterium]
MDCDQVFAVLTRGPFPSGSAEDALVDEHLNGCPDCWRIAEALRPADDVPQEALSPRESRELPAYWGDVMPPGTPRHQPSEDDRQRPVALAIASRARLKRQRATPVPLAPAGTRDRASAAWSRLAIVLGVAAAVGGVVAQGGWPFG